MSDLPVIESCEGCGACCMTQGSPPGYVMILRGELCGTEADFAHVQNMPEPARAAVVNQLNKPNRDSDGPCCWLDLATRRCQFYDYRPSFCRHGDEHPFGDDPEEGVFPGNDSCRSWRDEFLPLTS